VNDVGLVTDIALMQENKERYNQTRKNPCANTPCQHIEGAECVLKPGARGQPSHACLCPTGQRLSEGGNRCKLINGRSQVIAEKVGKRKDPCEDFLCKNDGKCAVNEEGKPYCTCADEYFVGDKCEEIACPLYCRNNGVCVPGDGVINVACNCVEGFYGPRCQHSLPEPSSEECSCHNGGKCGEGKCHCPLGYEGETCERCVKSSAACLNGGVCRLTDDKGPECHCLTGYTGERCEMTACADPLHCMNGGSCFLDDNEAKCACQPSFGGERCQRRVCQTDSCMNGGTPVITREGPCDCKCKPGNAGKRCENVVDEGCQARPCLAGGTCRSDGVCACIPGRIGLRCENADPCEGYCQNNGRCFLSPKGDPHCSCVYGFHGKTCQHLASVERDDRRDVDSALQFLLGVAISISATAALAALAFWLIKTRKPSLAFKHRRMAETLASAAAAPSGSVAHFVNPAYEWPTFQNEDQEEVATLLTAEKGRQGANSPTEEVEDLLSQQNVTTSS